MAYVYVYQSKRKLNLWIDRKIGEYSNKRIEIFCILYIDRYKIIHWWIECMTDDKEWITIGREIQAWIEN